MPKSKRNKTVDLSKTKKHGLEGKKELYKKIQSSIEEYAHVFVFAVNDMRNSKMKNVREQWKHSRFFIGKNKVMAMALGRTPEEEYRPNLYKIGQMLIGERGLFFTNQSVDEVTNWFQSYSVGDFARSGNTATEDVILPEGPLVQFPHNLESYLRQLGLPTTLKKGVIHLIKEHAVCREGDVLSPETARILKLLGYEMAEFCIKILSVWSQDGTFTNLQSDSSNPESKENIACTNKKSFMREDFELAKDCLFLGDNDKMKIVEVGSENNQKVLNNSEDLQEEMIEKVSKLQTPEREELLIEADRNPRNVKSEENVLSVLDKKEETEQIKLRKSRVKSFNKEKQVDGDEALHNSTNSGKNSPYKFRNDTKGPSPTGQLEKEDEKMEEIPELKRPRSVSTVRKTGRKTTSNPASRGANKQTNVDVIVSNEEVSSEEKIAILNLSKKKLEESAEKPKKFSPKMTRARAAAANKKLKTPEPVEAKRTTRKGKM